MRRESTAPIDPTGTGRGPRSRETDAGVALIASVLPPFFTFLIGPGLPATALTGADLAVMGAFLPTGAEDNDGDDFGFFAVAALFAGVFFLDDLATDTSRPFLPGTAAGARASSRILRPIRPKS
ncbi:MAG: hypothetical protein ACREIT_04310 [Tepidisphaeraceae bacterium]